MTSLKNPLIQLLLLHAAYKFLIIVILLLIIYGLRILFEFNGGDYRSLTIGLLNAYSKHVDPKIYDKLKFLQYEAKIEFNHKFIEDLARFLKANATIIYT